MKPHKQVVLAIEGATSALLAWNDQLGGIGNRLIWDNRFSPEGRVRKLSTAEAGRIAGWSEQRVEEFMEATRDWTEDKRAYLIGSSTSVDLAEALLWRAGTRVAVWKQRLSEFSAESLRASGGSRRRVLAPFRSAAMATTPSERVRFLMNQSLAGGTRITYALSLQSWISWRVQRGLPTFYEGENWVQDEQCLCEYVSDRALIGNYALNTINVNLAAISRHHIENGYPDPRVGRRRLKLVMEGIRRLQGRVVRKVPVPMSLIRSLPQKKDLSRWDDLVTITAITVMFLFLLRSGEALKTEKGQDLEKVIKTNMIAFRCRGTQVWGDGIMEADELILCIGKTKADQLGQGKVINLHSVPGDPLCPVNLMKRMYRMNDQHFNERGWRFLFTLSNGKLIHRRRVVDWLRGEAKACGLPEEALSVISLRAGGASAMHAAGCTGEEIRLRGRWESDCWRHYVWGGEDVNRTVALRMLSSTFTPLAALQYFSRA